MSGVGLTEVVVLVAEVLEDLGACHLAVEAWIAWGVLVLVLLG